MLKWFPEFRLENSYRGNSYSYFHVWFPSSNYLIIDFKKMLCCFVCFVCLQLKLRNKNALCCYVVTEDWFIKASIPLLTVTSNKCLGKENKKYSSDKTILPVRFWYAKLQRSYRPGFDFFFSPSPRIKWLQQGSRGLFGNVFEDDVYILIDTSQSMKDKLPLVKEKIFQLIQVWWSDASEDWGAF